MGMESSSLPDLRDYFAAERTFLAWVRTGLALIGFGFLIARFGIFLREMETANLSSVKLPSLGISRMFGVLSMGLGAVVHCAGACQFRSFRKRFFRKEPYLPPRFSLGVFLAIMLSILSVSLGIYFFRSI